MQIHILRDPVNYTDRQPMISWLGPFFQAGFQTKYKILFSSYIYQQTLYSTVWGLSQLFTLSGEGGVTVTALYWRHLLLALYRSFIYSLFGMSHVRHYKITKVPLHKLNTNSGSVRVTPLVCGNTIGYFRNLNYCREIELRSNDSMLWYDKEMTKLGTVNLRYVDLTKERNCPCFWFNISIINFVCQQLWTSTNNF